MKFFQQKKVVWLDYSFCLAVNTTEEKTPFEFNFFIKKGFTSNKFHNPASKPGK